MPKKTKVPSVISLETLLQEMTSAQSEADNFNHGIKVAGTRLRKHLLEIKKLCGTLRAEVSAIRNNM